MEKEINIYIYSDESGVFDKKYNNIYVFGGVIILGSKEKEIRAADIIANKIYYLVRQEEDKKLKEINNLNIEYLP